MKILILFFSGTGNTEYVSRYIQAELQKIPEEITVDRFSLEFIDPNDLLNYDLIYLGFPIYALDAPSNVKNFIDKLPDLSNKGVVLFATMGLAAGNAFYRLYSRMKHLNIAHIGSFAVKMPGSDGLAMLGENSRYVKNALNRDYSHFTEFDDHFKDLPNILQIFKSKGNFTSAGIPPKKQMLDTLFGWPFRGMYKLMEKFIKKRFWVDASCTLCKQCIHQCPMTNIELEQGNNQIKFGTECIVCLRCIHQCPTAAIQIGNFTKNKFRWRGPLGDFHPMSKNLKKTS